MTNLDLNLLRVFDTLMDLRSVTRAAERLRLTQSAISHALGRLRATLEDPLFVRGPHGLQPTARAMEIAAGVRDGLLRLESALTPSRFDPASVVRRFNLAAGTYFCGQLIPALVERVRKEAPGISFRVFPVSDDPAAALDEGLVDLVLGVFNHMPSRLVSEFLYEEEMVWIAAHPAPSAAGLSDPDILATHQRVVIVANGGRNELGQITMQDSLRAEFAGREVAQSSPEESITVYDSRTAIAVVASTDLVALVPRRAVQQDEEHHRVRVLQTASAPPLIPISMLWHSKQREDAGLSWARAVLTEVANAG